MVALTMAARNQVLNWILECKKMSKKEINNILDKVDDIALTTFVQAIQTDEEQDTPLASKNRKGKKLLVEELKESLPKDKYAKIKAVLMVIGPKAINVKEKPISKSYDKNSVYGLSIYIKDCVKLIEFNHHKSLIVYMNIAVALSMLKEKLQHLEIDGVKKKGLTKKDCYPVIQKETGFAQSPVSYYDVFLKFMTDYPRFQYCSLTFNQIKENLTMLRDWFDNQDKLSPVDYTSRQFWKVDLDYEKVTKPMKGLKIEDSTIGVDVEHYSSEYGSDDESTQVNQNFYDSIS
jgi:hypothetical protein